MVPTSPVPSRTQQPARPATVTAAAGLTGVAAIGSALMAIAHAGVTVPVLSSVGPGGDAAVPPAVAAFGIGAVLFTAVTVGLVRLRSWAWPVAVVLLGLTLAGAAFPFRGVGSAVGIAVCLASLGLLLTASARAMLLGAGRSAGR